MVHEQYLFGILYSIYDPLVIETNALAPGTSGDNYYQPLSATGGLSPYTWSITSGTCLPD